MTRAERVRQDGELRGLRRALETVLTSRFGSLPAELATAVAAADAERLETWLDRAGVVETLAEVGIAGAPPSG